VLREGAAAAHLLAEPVVVRAASLTEAPHPQKVTVISRMSQVRTRNSRRSWRAAGLRKAQPHATPAGRHAFRRAVIARAAKPASDATIRQLETRSTARSERIGRRSSSLVPPALPGDCPAGSNRRAAERIAGQLDRLAPVGALAFLALPLLTRLLIVVITIVTAQLAGLLAVIGSMAVPTLPHACAHGREHNAIRHEGGPAGHAL
jgi:hypothetical protein